MQSGGLISILTNTIKSKGVKGLYSGSGALIAGNGLKAGVRFMTYDSVKDVFRGADVSDYFAHMACRYGMLKRGVQQRWTVTSGRTRAKLIGTGQAVYNRQHVVGSGGRCGRGDGGRDAE